MTREELQNWLDEVSQRATLAREVCRELSLKTRRPYPSPTKEQREADRAYMALHEKQRVLETLLFHIVLEQIPFNITVEEWIEETAKEAQSAAEKTARDAEAEAIIRDMKVAFSGKKGKNHV